ncbi:hypothetical protein FOL47_009618 [Perkinsus chesapeaki]|uniref:Major facilitator superfamily (MFS) profile domain-containing protein n=1 Tax=Perkinsus chesapeaki TaxID=330153 RepID=A0A7J6L7B2_PERCH|nr:hypothetical protein FOL47_009618 [Perkinsus chesapeaki]
MPDLGAKSSISSGGTTTASTPLLKNEGGEIQYNGGETTARSVRKTSSLRHVVDLVIVYASVIVDFMGYTLIAPLLSTIVGEFGSGGVSHSFAASVLMSSYGLGQFISALIMGPTSDHLGRRPVLIAAYFLTCLCYLGQAFSENYWGFAVLRFCNGMATGTRPVAFSYLGDISSPERMPFYSMLVGVMIAFGSLMPLLGGMLGAISWRLPLLISAGLSGLLFLLSAVFLRESLVPEDDHVKASLSPTQPSSSVFWLTVALIALTAACVQFDNISIITSLPWLLTSSFGIEMKTVGAILGSQAVPTLLTNLLIFLPLSKVLPVCLLALAGMCGQATMFLLPLLKSKVAVVAVSYLLNFGNAMVYSSVPVLVKIVSPPSKRGLINGIVLSCMLLAGAIGPLVAGLLWGADHRHYTTFAAVSGVAGLGAVSMLVIYLILVRRQKRASNPCDSGTAVSTLV